MPQSFTFLFLATTFFLFFSSFFSALEAAYLSLDRVAIHRLKNSKFWISKLVIYFLNKINFFLFSLLAFNLFNNIMATLLASKLTEKLMIRWGVIELHEERFRALLLDIAFIIVFTSLLLIFSELIPKKIAIKHPRLISLIGTFPMIFVYFIFFPLIYLIHSLWNIFYNSQSSPAIEEVDQKKYPNFRREELPGYIERIFQSEGFEASEGSLLKSIIHYMNTPISSLVPSRADMEGFDLKNITDQNLYSKIKSFPQSYILLYQQNKDQILGLVTKKKLVSHYLFQKNDDQGNHKRFHPVMTKDDLLKLSHFPIMVPESKNVLDVLQDIYYSKSNVAIVTDEYGGIEGVISQEKIVHKIFESFSSTEENFIRKLKDGDYLVKADTSLNAVNEYFKTILFCDQAETIGGYLLEKIREIPKKGFEYRDDFFIYQIKSRNSRKIINLKIRKNS